MLQCEGSAILTDGVKMIRKIQILIAILVLLTAILACNLPKNASPTSTTTPSQPVSLSTQSQAHVTADFSQVRLEQADLPQGFNQISESELAQYGLNVDTLLNSITTPLAKAKPENLTVFSKIEGLNTTFVVSFILQPLTLLERPAFDLLTRDPKQAANLFQGAVTDFSFTPLTGVDTIGDAMLAMTFTYGKTSLPLTGELVISRRKQVIQVAVETSLLGGTPAVSALDVARIMDDKILTALK